MSASDHEVNGDYPLLIIDLETGKEVGAFALELSNRSPELSPTELTELKLASLGMKEADAAKERVVSQATVKTHRKRVRDKLGSPTMAGAIRNAIEKDILAVEQKPIPLHTELTPAEINILNLASLGLNTAESAKAMKRSRETIKAQCKSIRRKLDARNMAGAVRLGFEYGYLQPTELEDK